MLSNGTDSRVVEDQKAQQSKFAKLLKDSIKDFSEWPVGRQVLAVAVFTGFIAALPTIAPAMIASVVAGGVVAHVGLAVLGGLALLFAAKATPYVIKGLKWSAEKTVDGAKYIGGKIKDGAVHATDKIKSSTSHVVHNLAQSLDRLSSQTNYSDAMLNSQLLSGDVKDKIVSIQEQLMGVFNDEEIANKDKLLEKILKDIVLQIESKKDHTQGTDSEKYVPEWDKQINFIKNLNAEKLHDLLTKQSSSKDTYFLYTIFSEHHDKVGRIVKQSKTKHRLSNVVENFNKVAGKYGIRKGATQSIENSLSKSSSLDSVKTDSTVSSEAELLNPAKHKEVKAPSSFREKMPSWLGGKKALEETTNVKYQDLSEPGTSSRRVGNSRFYVDTPTPIENTNETATIGGRSGVARRGSTGNLTRVGTPEVPTRSASLTNLNELNASSQNSLSEKFGSNPIRVDNEVWYDAVTTLPDKGALTHSNSTDSGIGSGSSTPIGQSLSIEELNRGLDEAMKELDLAVSQLPSTKVDEVKPESTQVKTVG